MLVSKLSYCRRWALQCLLSIFTVFVTGLLWAQTPQWWYEGLNPPVKTSGANDYAAVNQGQVKNIAVKAVAELDADLPGGAGDILRTLATNLSGSTMNTNDYAAVNLGQLKALTVPFFDRLLVFRYYGHPLETGTYPWLSGSANPANDYAMANIGQVKNLFSFDLTITGTNGLPDWWQNYYFGAPVTDSYALAPSGILLNGTVVTILDAYRNHLNPVDFYNGVLPALSITGGDQSGAPGTVSSTPLIASVNNGAQNAPITFTVIAGEALLSATTNDPAPATTVQTRTSITGEPQKSVAQVYIYFPNTFDDFSTIRVAAGSGTSSVSMNTTAVTSGSSGGGGSGGGGGAENEIPTPPLVSYPTIDVSGGGVPGTVLAIALNDSNNGAYAYWDPNGLGPCSITWVNGQATGSINSAGIAHNWTDNQQKYDGGFDGVGADGTLYGSVQVPWGEGQWPSYRDGWFGYECKNSVLSEADDGNSGFQILDISEDSPDGLWVSEIWGSTNNGYCGRSAYLNGDSMADFLIFVVLNGAVIAQWRYDWPGGDIESIPINFKPYAMSDGGYAIGYCPANGGGMFMSAGGSLTMTGFDDGLLSVNNQGQVIGNNFSGGFIWQDGNHTPLASLIPSDYQGQISNITSRLLSNPDANGTIHVLFDATFTNSNDGSASQKTYVLSGPSPWNLQEVQLPDGVSSSDIKRINANGVMAAISNNKPLLLLPFEIRDVRNWSDANDDVLIQTLPQGATVNDDYWKAATDKNIAWIDPHRKNDGPDMPQLEVGFPGGPSGINVKWKFKCWYDRGNDVRKSRNQTEDTITIDKTSSPMPANQMWKLHQEPEWSGDFFGGKCELTYQLVGSDGSSLTSETTVRFVIGGKNPDNAKAKTYIQSCPDAGQTGNLWFAYAIAKCETGEYRYNGSFYNQFRPNPANSRLGSPTWNNDGDDVPGGYGIFQLTGNVSDATANISRKQIWNWQENVKGGLDLLRSKRTTAVDWMTQQRNSQNANGTALPSHTVGSVTFAEGTNRKMEDAVTMKLYNGASRAPTGFVDNGSVPGFLLDPQGAGHYCFWKNAASRWALNRFNRPNDYPDIQPFNYVSRVCAEVE